MEPGYGRRARRSLNYWPGFVDALAALIMVVIFVLLIFVLAQNTLSGALLGRDEALEQMTRRLGQAQEQLELERSLSAELRLTLARLSNELQQADSRNDALAAALAGKTEEQGASAEEAKRLAGLLDSSEAALKTARRQIERNARTIEVQRARIAGLTAEGQGLARSIATLEELRRNLGAEILALTARGDTLDENLAQARSDLAAALQRIEALSVSLANLRGSAEDAAATEAGLERRLAAREADVAALTGTQADLEAELKALDSKVQALEESLALSALERRRLEGLLTDERAALARADESRSALEQRLQRSAEAGKTEAEERERLIEALASVTGERDSLLELAERLAAERNALADRLAVLERERDAGSGSLAMRLAQLEQDLALKDEALSETRARLTAADQIEKGMQGELASLRAERDSLALGLSEAKAQIEGRDAALDRLTELAASLQSELAASRSSLTLADRRLKLAEEVLDAERARGSETAAALAEEEALSEAANLKVERLEQQIAALEQRLGQLAEALDASETLNEERRVEIVNLGKRLNEALATKVQELARYRSEFFGRLREVLSGRGDIRVVGDRFVLQSEVLFPSASADLSPAGEAQLAELAQTLKRIIAEIPGDIDWVLQVNGHTDQRPLVSGTFESNWELSAERALTVVRFLIAEGIPADRLAAAGFAEFQPLATGRDAASYRLNRRIELKLTQR
ncbi:MAG: peptidoglycan -binding protein [Rhodospirillales bacterium]|nr:peptidoglycan -binding protein [Rhodospirillales bacterium]